MAIKNTKKLMSKNIPETKKNGDERVTVSEMKYYKYNRKDL